MSWNHVHVVRVEGLQWVIESGDGSSGRQLFPSRDAAIAAGVAIAQHHKVDLVVHCRDGRVSRRHSFSDDAVTSEV